LNIYIVRHCKAEGQSPSANLTDEGFLQAEKLAKFLYDKNIERIISSPYARAYQSILPLAEKLRMKITIDTRLSERILCSENHPDWREMLRNTFDDLELCYEGGESSSTAIKRALSVITEVENSETNDIAIVTHGNLMSLLLKFYNNNIGYEEWEVLSNPDVYLLHFGGGTSPFMQRIWND
jgi:2,3-bisphosphoglycerate-dependent phosphoglycerate mutase